MTPILAAFALAGLWSLAWAPFFGCCCECGRIRVIFADCVAPLTITKDGVTYPWTPESPRVAITGNLAAGTYAWSIAATSTTEADSGTAVVVCGSDTDVNVTLAAKSGHGKDRMGDSSGNYACCTGPDSMTVTSSNTTIYSWRFQNTTLTWQAVPSGLDALIGANAYLSPFTFPDGFGDYFGYFLYTPFSTSGGLVYMYRVWTDKWDGVSGYEPSVESVPIWTWAVTGSGRCNTRGTGPPPALYDNSCVPVALLSGTAPAFMPDICFQVYE